MAVNQACYDAVRDRAPHLWRVLHDELLPTAGGDGDLDSRVRVLAELERMAWLAFLEDDTGSESRALGRSWPCVVDDLTAAMVEAAIPAIADGAEPPDHKRERLTAVLSALQEGRTPSLAVATAMLEVKQALAALDGA
jgi:hypothetical protein